MQILYSLLIFFVNFLLFFLKKKGKHVSVSDRYIDWFLTSWLALEFHFYCWSVKKLDWFVFLSLIPLARPMAINCATSFGMYRVHALGNKTTSNDELRCVHITDIYIFVIASSANQIVAHFYSSRECGWLAWSFVMRKRIPRNVMVHR